jgi:ubiquinone/menaquinone biosynthesis C-methylase UbiE
MRDWYAYVVNSGIENTLQFLWNYMSYYHPSFRKVVKHAPCPAGLLEVGAGTGFFGMWLSSYGYTVTMLDIDSRIIELARTNASAFNVPKDRLRILQGNALDLPNLFERGSFKLTYTRGLLEHFPEGEAVRVLRGQAYVAEKILSIVPSKNMKPWRTDERLFTMSSLETLHHKAGLRIIDRFSYGDEPRWFRYAVPLILQRPLERIFEIGSNIGVVAVPC